MATTDIKIKFVVEDEKSLDQAIVKMAELGKITEKDAEIFKKVGSEFKKGVSDELNAAGVSAKQFTDALTKGATTATTATKSLRQQLAEAKQAAIEAGEKFGQSSEQFRNAAKRAGELKAELGDLNATLDALDPDAKAKAFNQVGQAAFGAFQVATGALQAFGVENEKVNKLAQQFQGFLNVTAGISQLGQLGDALKNVSTVLGFTTQAQKATQAATVGATVAIEAEAAASTTAAAATKSLTAALITSPLFLFAAAAGAVAGAIYLIDEANEEALESSIRLQKKFQDIAAANNQYYTRINELIEENTDKIQFQIDLSSAQGASQGELLRLELQRQRIIDQTLARAIESGRLESEAYAEAVRRRKEAGQEIQIIEAQITKFNADEAQKRIDALQKERDAIKDINQSRALDAKDYISELAQAVDNDINRAFEEISAGSQRTFEGLVDDVNDWYDKSKDYISLGVQAFNEFGAALTDISAANAEARIDIENAEFEQSKERYDQLLKDKAISTAQYDKTIEALEAKRDAETKRIQREQAVRERNIALFSTAINTAAAIMNQLRVTPLPAGLPLVLSIGVTGAAQLAAIAAQPLPKFAKGTLSVQGGTDGQDSVHAMVMPGEAIIPTRTNRRYKEAVKAIYHESVPADELAQFVTLNPQMRYALLMAAGEQFNSTIVNKPTNISTAQVMSNYISNSVRGGSATVRGGSSSVDLSGLRSDVRNNKAVKIDNTKQLAQSIADAISSTNNARRKW